MKRYRVFIAAAILALLSGCSSHANEARISFTGDIMMHIPVKTCALMHDSKGDGKKESLNNKGFDFLFDGIRSAFAASDIVVGNMEFPVSPPFQSMPQVFNCYPEVVPAMKKAGFTMLTMANNHVLDQDVKGILSSLSYVRRAGLDSIGVALDEKTARAGIVKEVGGIRIGFIAYTGYLNFRLPARMDGYHLNWLYDKADLHRDIVDMRKRCDYLIMVVHTGIEYTTGPRPTDTDLFRKCIDDGVDLVVGHHPHLLQPAEKYKAADGRECYIFYSLGNFISNQSTKAGAIFDGAPITTRDSVIVDCILKRPASGNRLAVRFEVLPIYTINIIEPGSGLRCIQTLSVPGEISRLKKRLAAADPKEKVDIEGQLQTLYQKIRADRKAVLRNGDINGIRLRDASGTN
jgi:poly-gamma-glutamate capsule biosynthesis protein CapA/YwtB (metallophosphatase superfamily)